MLQITVPKTEFYDEEEDRFVETKETVLKLEHSLISLSKWESKWHKPFLAEKEKSVEEIIDYVKCMTLNPTVDPMVYSCITEENLDSITKYMEDTMTATWFNENKQNSNRRVSTSELIYSQMIKAGVPFECAKWHLNRLMTLIRVCAIENLSGEKKMSRTEVAQQNRELNAARRAALNSKG